MVSVSYCGLEEQTLTLLLRSVRANCALHVLRLEGNNLTGKGTFILSELLAWDLGGREPPLVQDFHFVVISTET